MKKLILALFFAALGLPAPAQVITTFPTATSITGTEAIYAPIGGVDQNITPNLLLAWMTNSYGTLSISAAGTSSTLTPTRPWNMVTVTVGAGTGAYTASIVLSHTGAIQGQAFELTINTPASTNPTLQIWDATTATGSPISTPPSTAVAGTTTLTFVYTTAGGWVPYKKGAFLISNSLAEIGANYAAAQANLHLVPGTNVEAHSGNLDTWSGVTPAASEAAALANAVNAASGLAAYDGSGNITFPGNATVNGLLNLSGGLTGSIYSRSFSGTPPTLGNASGPYYELGFATDTHLFYVGNGTTDYVIGGAGTFLDNTTPTAGSSLGGTGTPGAAGTYAGTANTQILYHPGNGGANGATGAFNGAAGGGTTQSNFSGGNGSAASSAYSPFAAGGSGGYIDAHGGNGGAMGTYAGGFTGAPGNGGFEKIYGGNGANGDAYGTGGNGGTGLTFNGYGANGGLPSASVAGLNGANGGNAATLSFYGGSAGGAPTGNYASGAGGNAGTMDNYGGNGSLGNTYGAGSAGGAGGSFLSHGGAASSAGSSTASAAGGSGGTVNVTGAAASGATPGLNGGSLTLAGGVNTITTSGSTPYTITIPAAANDTLAVLGQTQTFTGAKTFTGGLTSAGFADSNTTPAAGTLGEFVVSKVAVGSAVSLSNGTTSNITTITLSAGTWLVHWNVNFGASSATTNGESGGITTTSATLPTDGTQVYSATRLTTATLTDSVSGASEITTTGGSTTVYLVGQPSFSAGTVVGYGSITAVRI